MSILAQQFQWQEFLWNLWYVIDLTERRGLESIKSGDLKSDEKDSDYNERQAIVELDQDNMVSKTFEADPTGNAPTNFDVTPETIGNSNERETQIGLLPSLRISHP